MLRKIEHSDPKISINIKSLCLEEFSCYWLDNLQEHLHYPEIDFCKFSVHFVMPSLKYLIDKYWNLARSECLIKTVASLAV